MSSISLFQNEESPEFKLLCVFVFDILISKLTNKNIKTYFPPSLINEKFPVFVTWSKGKEKNLRGCIGTFYPDNLKKNLENFGLTAAFKDSRFPPISKEEIEDLNCGISILIILRKQKIVMIGKLESMEYKYILKKIDSILQLFYLKFQLNIIWIKKLLYNI